MALNLVHQFKQLQFLFLLSIIGWDFVAEIGSLLNFTPKCLINIFSSFTNVSK